MPDMLQERRDPGCFYSKNKEFIYVIGGKNNSVERLSISGFKKPPTTQEERRKIILSLRLNGCPSYKTYNDAKISKAILEFHGVKWEPVEIKGIELLNNSWGYCIMPLWKIKTYKNE